MTVLDDRSVLAGGVKPATDVYEIETQLDAGPFTAIRLEGLPYPSLPVGEASRGELGNVLLSEFELEIVSPAESDIWQGVRIERAWADREVAGFTIDRAIDGQQATGWGSMGTERKSTRTAVFISQRPFGNPAGTQLRIRLRHENQHWAHRQFGRFRLSATAAPHVLEAAAVDQLNRDLRDALVGDTPKPASSAPPPFDSAAPPQIDHR
ncbi:MAG: hypothetical protein ACREHD_13790 [Pirellulales bacterium]